MKQLLSALLFGVVLLSGCQTGGATNDSGEDGESGAFGDDGGAEDGADEPDPIVLERDNVQRFRGQEMVELLKQMESSDPADWQYVRRHVHPSPTPPVDKNGRRNFVWPPSDMNDLNDQQTEWLSYELWPQHIRELLQQEREVDDEGRIVQLAWDHPETRERLANYGRLYELVYEFQTRKPHPSATRESEYWRAFAETMLVYGEDGEGLLTSNMILALTNPDENIVELAQQILVQLGPKAIEPLCTALWTAHRQLVAYETPGGDLQYKAVGNPNFNNHIVETLILIGPRAAPQAMYELNAMLNKQGKAVGSGWRFRTYFIELLGSLGPALARDVRIRALQTLESEYERVIVEEYEKDDLAEGEYVLNETATDDARFTFHGHLIEAVGELGLPEGLRLVIKIWEQDEFHEVSASQAIRNMTGKRNVRSIRVAKELANSLDVKLD